MGAVSAALAVPGFNPITSREALLITALKEYQPSIADTPARWEMQRSKRILFSQRGKVVTESQDDAPRIRPVIQKLRNPPMAPAACLAKSEAARRFESSCGRA